MRRRRLAQLAEIWAIGNLGDLHLGRGARLAEVLQRDPGGASVPPALRLDQTYRRRDDHHYDYTSQTDFRALLEYDAAGLIVDYPGIAVRFA